MSMFKNLLVGLNLSDLDNTTIPYAAMMFRLTHAERIYFMHVTRNLTIPQRIAAAYPTMIQPPDEFAVHQIQTKLQEHGHTLPHNAVNIDVVEGTPLDELLERSGQKNIHLIIMGRKHNEKQTRQLPLKLTRKAPCSVLVIPDGSPANIQRILVPIDFSDCAKKAFIAGIQLAKDLQLPELQALHVYSIPTGYHRTGKSLAEFGKIMKENAILDYREFVSDIDLKNLRVKMHFVLGKHPSQAIQQFARRQKSDLIITGARGRTASAAMLLGSVTERIIQTTNVPILAVKQGDSCMTFGKALFNL